MRTVHPTSTTVADQSRNSDELETLWRDSGSTVCRGSRILPTGERAQVLVLTPATPEVAHELAHRQAHEFGLREHLDAGWAVMPIQHAVTEGALILRDPGGDLLAHMISAEMPIREVLLIAIALADAVTRMHKSGVLHRDIKPSNVMLDCDGYVARLMGFGVAIQASRNSMMPVPTDVIAGTFAYMAPEQTGRMNRTTDYRSDLYSLGVTLYELVTGVLPFRALDLAEWIHCHVARQPMPASERRADVPAYLSSVVMKLLSKAPEARYQTAAGLKADLVRCLQMWEGGQRDAMALTLGEYDYSAQLLFHERLYGRELELARLTRAFDRVVQTGERQLVLVSGYSGVGKSSLVNQLRGAVAAVGGLFATGKFDQYKREIPYAPLTESFRSVVRGLLGRPDRELQIWREAMCAAVGANGQLVVHLIPELEILIGRQPPVAELSGVEARSRLLQLFSRFVGVFARHGHPLVLFLDDLQWLDPATLNVFETLATQPDVNHLLLIGAYRNNEVDESHPLRPGLDAVRRANVGRTEVVLEGIRPEDITDLIADAARRTDDEVRALGECVHQKTGGNPFFAVQFVGALTEAGLLTFDESRSRWRWDLELIREQQVSDNIVELMIGRLQRLSSEALSAVCTLACMGNRAERAALCAVLQEEDAIVRRRFEEAIRTGLVLESRSSYAFSHDRVHEAAYALLSPEQRAARHSFIGKRLRDTVGEGELDARVFEIVTHLNRAGEVPGTVEEQVVQARLNLRAARKARASAAYGAACDYLAAGRRQLEDDGWQHHDLSFELALEHAECSFLAGRLPATKTMVDQLLLTASSALESFAAYRLKVELHVVCAEYEDAIATGLIALRLLGIDLKPHPSHAQIEQEYARVWSKLERRSIESIANLPPMVDPARLAAMRLLAELWPPTYFSDFNLTVMVVCQMVDLSLEYGSSPLSSQGFALLGWLMGPVFNRFEQGHRLTRLACDLVAGQNAPLDYGRTCVTMALTSSWTEPLNVAQDWYRLGYREAMRAGDVYFACYCGYLSASLALIHGQRLDECGRDARDRVKFATEIGFLDGEAVARTVERTIACLVGGTRALTDFSDAAFDGEAFESAVVTSHLSVLKQWYWTRKTMLFLLAGDAEAALAASSQVYTGPWTRVVQIEYMDHHYFTALAICALISQTPKQDHAHLRIRLAEHHRVIREWAGNTASPTFADKPLLVNAEIARIENRALDAEQLYEHASRVAHENGLVHHEALACELAARFYRERGLDRIADMYLRHSLECYGRWGATAKVKQLVNAHPALRGSMQRAFGDGTTMTSAHQIDLANVLRSSNAVSSEVIIDRLLTTLMRTVAEHAGAQRAVLLRPENDRFEAEAQAETVHQVVVVGLGESLSSIQRLPTNLLRFVARTGESVIVDDALVDPRFNQEAHIVQDRVRSMMCLPIISHGKLLALLYLENNLAPRVFTQAHLDVLRLLAGQAAISLENARLYVDLAAREAKIRRIFDSDVIGIVFWELTGQLTDANDAFLNMLGYSREELASGSLRWTDMTPPEWHDQIAREVRELNETGALKPIEKEYFHKSGVRVPVLLGAATFGSTQQGVAIIVDLRKQKEAEARTAEIERHNHVLHAELAHANRIATVGHLSAWIAHDVKQPLASVVNSGNAALRWMRASPPNIAAAERNLQRIVADGMRAASVLDKIHALIRKASPKAEAVDVNSIVRETCSLVATEANRSNTIVRTHLHGSKLLAIADRTQVQQVLLNLIVNAMEAMRAETTAFKRELLIVSAAEGKEVTVSVFDTGPGLGAAEMESCFEAFYTTKAEGLGMGLAICRSIINSYGGRISVGANSPRGAMFKFVLPAA